MVAEHQPTCSLHAWWSWVRVLTLYMYLFSNSACTAHALPYLHHKYERENVQNDLEVVGPVQPVLPVHVELELVPTAITVLALPPVDQLQYLHDEACHSQDYSDGRRKVEEVAPVSGNVCVGRGTDGYIVYTVDTCMSTPPTWLEVATCIYSVTVVYATYSIYEAYPLPPPLPPPPLYESCIG